MCYFLNKKGRKGMEQNVIIFRGKKCKNRDKFIELDKPLMKGDSTFGTTSRMSITNLIMVIIMIVMIITRKILKTDLVWIGTIVILIIFCTGIHISMFKILKDDFKEYTGMVKDKYKKYAGKHGREGTGLIKYYININDNILNLSKDEWDLIEIGDWQAVLISKNTIIGLVIVPSDKTTKEVHR